MHIYLANAARAHAKGQHGEANQFRSLADDYYNRYSEAKQQAVQKTLELAYFIIFNQQKKST